MFGLRASGCRLPAPHSACRYVGNNRLPIIKSLHYNFNHGELQFLSDGKTQTTPLTWPSSRRRRALTSYSEVSEQRRRLNAVLDPRTVNPQAVSLTVYSGCLTEDLARRVSLKVEATFGGFYGMLDPAVNRMWLSYAGKVDAPPVYKFTCNIRLQKQFTYQAEYCFNSDETNAIVAKIAGIFIGKRLGLLGKQTVGSFAKLLLDGVVKVECSENDLELYVVLHDDSDASLYVSAMRRDCLPYQCDERVHTTLTPCFTRIFQVRDWPISAYIGETMDLPPGGEPIIEVSDTFLCPGQCGLDNPPPDDWQGVQYWTEDRTAIGGKLCDGTHPCYGKCKYSADWVTATCRDGRWTIDGTCPAEGKCS